MDTPVPNSVAEQARLELSVAASSAERANRPRILVWIGALLVVAAGIALATAASRRGAEALRLVKAKAAAEAIEKQKQELEGLMEQVRSRGLEPDPRMAAKLEALALGAGVKLLGGVSDTTETGNLPGGLMKKIYTAKVAAGEDPNAVMSWLASTQDPRAVRWLEIAQLRFTPAAGDGRGALGGLNCDVRFSRYEKKEVRP